MENNQSEKYLDILNVKNQVPDSGRNGQTWNSV